MNTSNNKKTADEVDVDGASCPTFETLQGIVSGTIVVGNALAHHLEHCGDCLHRLSQLSDSDALSEYRTHAQHLVSEIADLEPPLSDGDLGSIDGLAIQAIVGRGGMGIVYRAHDMKLGRTVAIKVLNRGSSAESDARFLREARAAAVLRHDHLVPVYSTGVSASGQSYLVMPLVEGGTLKSRLEQGPLSAAAAARIIQQIARGVAVAHLAGLIHRDIKPANILLDGNDGRGMLTDFGLVRASNDDALTRANVVCGTSAYMSPEQIADPSSQDARGDIYSLGIVLYESLTGTPPFRGLPMEILDQHRTVDPLPLRQLNSAVPLDLQNICLKSISKSPSQRYATATELADDLERFLTGKPVQAKETPAWRKFLLWTQRNRAVAGWVGISFALLTLLATGTSVAAWRLGRANTAIRVALERAEQAEGEALADRSAAVDSLERLIDSLYNDLSANAATIHTREKIVVAAVAGLEAMAATRSDARTDRTALRAYLRLGDLASLRGSSADAERYYLQAIDSAKALTELSSVEDGIVPLKDLALANIKSTEHYFAMSQASTRPQLETSQRLLNELRSVQRQSGSDSEAWISVQQVVLDTLEMELARRDGQKPQQLLVSSVQALEHLAEARELAAESTEFQVAAQKLHFVIGRAYLEDYQGAKADEQFALGQQYIDQLLASYPKHSVYLNAAGSMLRARGMALGSLGKLDQATPYLERAVGVLIDLSMADQENRSLAINVANTQSILATAYQLAAQWDQAIETLESSVTIYRKLVKMSTNDPSSSLMIIKCLLNTAEIELRLGRWEEAEFTISQAKQELGQPATAYESVEMKSIYSANLAQETHFEEAIAHLLGKPVVKTTDEGSSIAIQSSFLVYASTAGDWELGDSQAKLLSDCFPDCDATKIPEAYDWLSNRFSDRSELHLNLLYNQIGVYGLIARNAAAHGTDEGLKVAQQATARCTSAIEQAFAIAPQPVVENVSLSPDLAWIRTQPDFQSAWSKITSPAKNP